MRVGDVALTAMQRQPPGQRAAPADLDRVAERLRAGRLADQAMIKALALRQRPVDELFRPVDRGAFLVAGDEKADRAGKRMARDEAESRRHRRSEPALHVAGAAPPELAL